MKIERAYIGGALDGQSRSVPEEWIITAEPTQVPVENPEHGPAIVGVEIKVHRYLLMTFHIPKTTTETYEFKAFVIDTITQEEAYKELTNRKLRIKP